MKRRAFLKATASSGVVFTAPTLFHLQGANAAEAANRYADADFQLPARLPQVINIFLYGGASELAGNLTNIRQINQRSQNLYPDDILGNLSSDQGQITPNGFWADAGGRAMEDMLSAGDLSVYRTINRRKNNTRAHRPSIFSSQKGSLEIDEAAGMGSTIAALLYQHREQIDGSEQLNGKTLEELVLPFVSFEGSSVAFAPDPDAGLPLKLRGLSLDERFNNPYSRSEDHHNIELDALVDKVVTDLQRSRFAKIVGGFQQRRRMERLIGNLQQAADNPLPTVPFNGTEAVDTDIDPVTGTLIYPENNRFSARIRAAVTLAVENPDSLFISLGGGLSSWDDHDGALDEYVPRMNQMMEALRVAAKHIRYSDISYGGSRDTRNIIINVHGDFGRNVNLNNSGGWDHGNNQNLYTIGGEAIRTKGALGKIVGRTAIFGDASENRLFTKPRQDSYEAEPMAIAASTYQYFGAMNPSALTCDAESNIEGDNAIDEQVEGETLR